MTDPKVRALHERIAELEAVIVGYSRDATAEEILPTHAEFVEPIPFAKASKAGGPGKPKAKR